MRPFEENNKNKNKLNSLFNFRIFFLFRNLFALKICSILKFTENRDSRLFDRVLSFARHEQIEWESEIESEGETIEIFILHSLVLCSIFRYAFFIHKHTF